LGLSKETLLTLLEVKIVSLVVSYRTVRNNSGDKREESSLREVLLIHAYSLQKYLLSTP
jgi:hypothetical protein